MDLPDHLLHYMAPLLPFRAFWMGMAEFDVLEEDAVEEVNVIARTTPIVNVIAREAWPKQTFATKQSIVWTRIWED